LASPITFNSGDGVFLDGTQDIGAYDYSAAGYSFGVSGTYAAGTLLIQVTNPAVVRMVGVYENGLLSTLITNVVGSQVISDSIASSSTQIRAYALYADPNAVVTAYPTAGLAINAQPGATLNIISTPGAALNILSQ
jgi:hypothetical protein